jgi:succinoglycan biosynthesis transport protein ExoP
VLGISILGGMLLGIAIGLVRDMSDRGIRTGEQVSREFQIACIAVVPSANSVQAKLRALFAGDEKRPKPALPATHGPRRIERSDSPIWTVTNALQSQCAESFIQIKLVIDSINRSGKRNQVIGVTSTRSHEGKSTIAVASALLMAQAGARVVLVDLNLREPSLSAALAPDAKFGFLDVMSGCAPVRDATWIEPTTGLAFIAVGNNSRSSGADEVSVSEYLERLFQTLRNTYEYVIVDFPAVAPFADVRSAACAVDSFIFVIDATRTNVDVVKRGLDIVRAENVLGIVLNKASYYV